MHSTPHPLFVESSALHTGRRPFRSLKVIGQWPGTSKYCVIGNARGIQIQKKKENTAFVLGFCGRKLLPGMGCVPLAHFWSESWSASTSEVGCVKAWQYLWSCASRHLGHALCWRLLCYGDLKGSVLCWPLPSGPGNFFFFCFPRVLRHTSYKKPLFLRWQRKPLSTLSDTVAALVRLPRKSLPPTDKSSSYVAYSFQL